MLRFVLHETSACKHSESAYLLHKQLLPHGFKNLSCHVNSACGCMGKGMCHPTAVSDDIETFVDAFKMLIKLYFHIIKFHFHTIKQCVIVCRSRCDLVQCIDHLNDAIQDTLRQHQT